MRKLGGLDCDVSEEWIGVVIYSYEMWTMIGGLWKTRISDVEDKGLWIAKFQIGKSTAGKGYVKND